jgi:peptide subunit release factor 1 (eRF1)
MLLLSESLPDKLMDELVEKGEEVGADVRIISKDTKEGQQLIGIGGIAAILRYAL